MDFYFLAIDLPSEIKQQLSSITYGLPSVSWIEEENFHLILREIGEVNDQILFDLQEQLRQMTFLPFSIQLKGIKYQQTKRGDGMLWIEGLPKESILKLKQQIDRCLKTLSALPSERSFVPLHVLLAKFENLSKQRLGEYLMMHGLFESASFEVSQFALFRKHKTTKRTFFEKIEVFNSDPLMFFD